MVTVVYFYARLVYISGYIFKFPLFRPLLFMAGLFMAGLTVAFAMTYQLTG